MWIGEIRLFRLEVFEIASWKIKPSEVKASEQIEIMNMLRQEAACHLLGIPRPTLRKAGPPRNPDKTYSASELLLWAVGRAKSPDGEDPMVSGADIRSPALEEWRRHKAAITKIILSEKRETVIKRDDVHEAFGRMGQILRSAGERIGRESPVAKDILDAALDDVGREVQAMEVARVDEVKPKAGNGKAKK